MLRTECGVSIGNAGDPAASSGSQFSSVYTLSSTGVDGASAIVTRVTRNDVYGRRQRDLSDALITAPTRRRDGITVLPGSNRGRVSRTTHVVGLAPLSGSAVGEQGQCGSHRTVGGRCGVRTFGTPVNPFRRKQHLREYVK